MRHMNQEASSQDPQRIHESSVSWDPPNAPSLSNVLTGVVSSRREGLTRTTYRIHIGKRTDVRMRWLHSSPSPRRLEIGQVVRLTIPQEAVQLEAGGFRCGKQRWNRWIGRVVLVSPRDGDGSITVKIHHDPITLRSCASVLGTQVPLTTWDTVNIVVDPQRINVCSCALASPPEPPRRPTSTETAGFPASVWLRAVVRCVRSMPVGYHLTLDAGAVALSALIESGIAGAASWHAGDAVEIAVGSADSRIRKDGQSRVLPCCIVLSMEFTDRPSMHAMQRRDE